MTTSMHVRRTFVRACALVALVIAIASPAFAQHLPSEKLDPVLRDRAQQLTGRSRVIVQFFGEPDVLAITSRRGTPGRALGRLQARVAEIDNAQIGTLASDPRVARVMVDRPVFATAERTGTAVGATLVREDLGLTGRGIGVAIVDSGITRWHDDLDRPVARRPDARVVHFKDFTRKETPNLWVPEVPTDGYGHGTHVAGIVAGSGYLSGGARTGMAPQAHLVGLKVLDHQGHGFISDVIAAIDYAVSVSRTYNIRIINLSIGSGVFESYLDDPLTLAAKRAVDAGLVVVAAAGNLGRGEDGEPRIAGITSPGNAPWVLTVGASTHQGTARRSDDAVAPFSSRGPTWIDAAAKPDLVAPGVGIESLADPQSTLYTTQAGFLLDGTRKGGGFLPYLSLSGTSMAAPVVTGAVALMLEANPALTPNAVKAILQFTAQELPGAHVLAQGAGLVNTAGAVRLARFFAEPRTEIGAMRDTIAGEPVAWARHLIWGNYRVTGGVPLPGSNAWEPALTWGAETMADGTPVFWGAAHASNIVWSTGLRQNIVWSTDDDDNTVWGTRLRTNIVWSTADADQAVWDTRLRTNIVWSTADADQAVWDTRLRTNIVWSTATVENVVWGDACGGRDCAPDDGTVWATRLRENIVWSTRLKTNIVWSTGLVDQVLWPSASGTAR